MTLRHCPGQEGSASCLSGTLQEDQNKHISKVGGGWLLIFEVLASLGGKNHQHFCCYSTVPCYNVACTSYI